MHQMHVVHSEIYRNPDSLLPWLSPLSLDLPLHLHLPLHLYISAFPSPIFLCLLHLLPVLLHPTLAVRVTELYPSCHQKGNARQQRGGGYRMVFLAILGIVMACCDTWKQPILHLRFIFFTVRCQRRHSA